MEHIQDCCEYVKIEKIDGDLISLIGSRIDSFSMDVVSGKDDDNYESWTKTTFHIITNTGECTIVWMGSSNGYYSEYVDFEMKESVEMKIYRNDMINKIINE